MDKLEKKRPAKHSIVENINLFGAKIRMAPGSLIWMAKEYHRAALLVAAGGRAEGQNWSPAEKFLACRSIELGLKAFLSLKGRRLEELSHGIYGHDLENLLMQADADGLSSMVELNHEERFAIDFSHRYYLDKVFEYPAVLESAKGYPDDAVSIDPLLSAATKLIATLYDPCFALDSGPQPNTIVIEAGLSKKENPSA